VESPVKKPLKLLKSMFLASKEGGPEAIWACHFILEEENQPDSYFEHSHVMPNVVAEKNVQRISDFQGLRSTIGLSSEMFPSPLTESQNTSFGFARRFE
jgi:hypothetical protein